MMGLPWVRIDSNLYTSDKILLLHTKREGHRAALVYLYSITYAGGHGTDGFIPTHVVPTIQGTTKTTQLLTESGLWKPIEGGWMIHNYEQRQELSTTTKIKRDLKSNAGKKSQCIQRHGADCGCWNITT